MLVLTRKINDTIIIDDRIKIEVLKVRKGGIRIGITAPDDVQIRRGELTPAKPSVAESNRFRIASDRNSSEVLSGSSSEVISGRIKVSPKSHQVPSTANNDLMVWKTTSAQLDATPIVTHDLSDGTCDLPMTTAIHPK